MATMPVDDYVNAPGRARLVKDVRKKIDALGITYIYYQFISVTGRIVGKGIPADHWERTAEKGFQLVYGSTANLFTDRHGQYIGYGPEASELIGIPDPETFCQLPWDKRVARVYCTCFRNREERVNPGGHLTSDCRGNLRILHEEFQKKHKGLHMRHGCEPEMMWLKKGEDGLPDGGFSKPNCYHIDQFESLRPVFMRAIEYSRAMGLDMIQGDHEDAPGQLELNFMFDDALRTADRLTTYRQICAQVAREFNLIACFMAKPFMGVSANGCHHNVSLWRGGEEKINKLGNSKLPGMPQNFTYLKGGENTFLPTKGQGKPGPIGLYSIGGVLKHMRALTALGSSTRRRRRAPSRSSRRGASTWGVIARCCVSTTFPPRSRTPRRPSTAIPPSRSTWSASPAPTARPRPRTSFARPSTAPSPGPRLRAASSERSGIRMPGARSRRRTPRPRPTSSRG